MKKYFFRRQAGNVTTTIEANTIFWSGQAVVFVKDGQAVAVIALMPGDVVIEEGAWTDLDKDSPDLKPKTEKALFDKRVQCETAELTDEEKKGIVN